MKLSYKDQNYFMLANISKVYYNICVENIVSKREDLQ